MSQSPSLRGSGRFMGDAGGGPALSNVSIPFIAGQWSLRTSTNNGRRSEPIVSIPFIAGQWSLQSLAQDLGTVCNRVSIPFIAGQWSLRGTR